MSLFSDTMLKAIADYRVLLRRHLDQVSRMRKLAQLNLRRRIDPEDEAELFQIGQLIVSDIQSNMTEGGDSYYSYSGVQQFGQYLEGFLSHYHVERHVVIHKAQHASRALLQLIQLFSMPTKSINDTVKQQMGACKAVVRRFGTDEQWQNFVQSVQAFRQVQPQIADELLDLSGGREAGGAEGAVSFA